MLTRRIHSALRAASRASASALPLPRASFSTVSVRLEAQSQTLPNPDPAPSSPTGQLAQRQQSYMIPTYSRPTPIFVRGKASTLWDIDDRAYLDFTSGIAVTSLGHANPSVSAIVADQSEKLLHSSNLYYNDWTGQLSELLVKTTTESGGMHDASHAFICNSGSEANEAAFKFARKVAKSRTGDLSTPKFEIVSFHNSFHGRTMGSLSATPNPKYQKPFGPMVPGHRYGIFNDTLGLDGLITENTCAVIVEPIQGEGGIHVATVEFLTALRARCDAVNAVLIYDEIQSGMGRSGRLWAHSYFPSTAHPDIITTAKALGNGFPIGATIVNNAVTSHIQVGDHGTTFGGNPLASRVGHYCLTELSSPALQSEVLRKSTLFINHFQSLQAEFPEMITEIRGKGLILGLQLSQDPGPIVTAARERGLLVLTAGNNTLRFLPPIVITDEEIERGVAILRESLRSVVGGGAEK